MLEEVNTFVLDFDGTLLDSVQFIEDTFHEVFKSHDLTISKEQFLEIATFPVHVIFKEIAPHIEHALLLKTLNRLQKKREHTLELFPGTISALDAFKNRGGKIAVLTARSKDSAKRLFKQMKIQGYIDFAIYPEDIINHKPHPEGIKKALQYFNSQKSKTIMVGDSLVDIQAGKAAGIKTVAVLTGFDKKNISDTHPDLILPDISYIHKHL